MDNNTFRCNKCGDILSGGMIPIYRDIIRKGGSVSGAIRCARCGTIYSAEQIAQGESEQVYKSGGGGAGCLSVLTLTLVAYVITLIILTAK